MPPSYTLMKLTEVEDSAPKFGMGEVQQARFANNDLEAARTGVSLQRLFPGRRSPFGHRHESAEEVYVVLAGSGRVKLDDEIIELEPMDAIRVAPEVMRAFEAGPEGFEMLAFGTRHDGDGEVIQGWWSD
ncbi:MAG TPA: cupin domain-containing protein [Solirubrobacteraceae bacterium]|nr:cupin domain-containing protein [Solirubrobacteraceae bacterium]